MSADRLRQAAQKIRDMVKRYEDASRDDPSYAWMAAREELMRLGFTRRDVALAVADWLDDIAADKAEGVGCIHPRALDLVDLILGGAE